MDFINLIMELFLHSDKFLADIISTFGVGTYLVMFAIIFIETGVVIMPFLPGDSVLFAIGALAAKPDTDLNVVVMFILLAVAAVLGDTVNYWIGHYIGPRAFSGKVRFLKKEYLEKTQAFYEKHGGKTIFLARFIPIIRTFAPFVAGVGRMNYGYFFSYNVFGGIVWTALFIFAGYFFGSLPFVEKNFSLVIIAIVFLSVLPPIVEFLRERSKSKKSDESVAESN